MRPIERNQFVKKSGERSEITNIQEKVEPTSALTTKKKQTMSMLFLQSLKSIEYSIKNISRLITTI